MITVGSVFTIQVLVPMIRLDGQIAFGWIMITIRMKQNRRIPVPKNASKQRRMVMGGKQMTVVIITNLCVKHKEVKQIDKHTSCNVLKIIKAL